MPAKQEADEPDLRLFTIGRSAHPIDWRCHRRLVSDFLTANGITVRHIMPTDVLRPHVLTPGAVIETGSVGYPAPAEDSRPAAAVEGGEQAG